ncbi:MAG: hypothetical protein Q8R26_02020 [bacterium]|nr:hypothetical protein [bacterium]
MLIDSTNIFDAFKKYQEWHTVATFQEFSKAYDECSCLLPTTQATRLDDTLKEDKTLAIDYILKTKLGATNS